MPQSPNWMQALTALIPMAGAGIAGQGTGLGAFGEQYARGAAVADEMRLREQEAARRAAADAAALQFEQQRAAQVAEDRTSAKERQKLQDLLEVMQRAPQWASQAVEMGLASGAPDPADYGRKQFDDLLEALATASPAMAQHRDMARMAAGDFGTLATTAKLRKYLPRYEQLTKGASQEHYDALLQSQMPVVEGMLFQDLDSMMQQAGKGYVPPTPEAPKAGTFEDYVQRAYGPKPTPQQILRARKEYQQADDRAPTNVYVNPTAMSDIDELASGIVTGAIAPSQLPKRGDAYNAMLARARRLYRAETGRELSMTKLENDYQAARKFTLSMNGPQMVRFNALAQSVVKTIDEVRALGDELKQGGIQAWNRAKRNTILQVYGNTPYSETAARYVGAVNTLKEEFANLAQGGYAPTESAWALANQQINEDFGVKDLGASLFEVQRLINYRMEAFREQAPLLTREPGTAPQAAGPVATPGPGQKVGRFEIVEIR